MIHNYILQVLFLACNALSSPKMLIICMTKMFYFGFTMRHDATSTDSWWSLGTAFCNMLSGRAFSWKASFLQCLNSWFLKLAATRIKVCSSKTVIIVILSLLHLLLTVCVETVYLWVQLLTNSFWHVKLFVLVLIVLIFNCAYFYCLCNFISIIWYVQVNGHLSFLCWKSFGISHVNGWQRDFNNQAFFKQTYKLKYLFVAFQISNIKLPKYLTMCNKKKT